MRAAGLEAPHAAPGSHAAAVRSAAPASAGPAAGALLVPTAQQRSHRLVASHAATSASCRAEQCKCRPIFSWCLTAAALPAPPSPPLCSREYILSCCDEAAKRREALRGKVRRRLLPHLGAGSGGSGGSQARTAVPACASCAAWRAAGRLLCAGRSCGTVLAPPAPLPVPAMLSTHRPCRPCWHTPTAPAPPRCARTARAPPPPPAPAPRPPPGAAHLGEGQAARHGPQLGENVRHAPALEAVDAGAHGERRRDACPPCWPAVPGGKWAVARRRAAACSPGTQPWGRPLCCRGLGKDQRVPQAARRARSCGVRRAVLRRHGRAAAQAPALTPLLLPMPGWPLLLQGPFYSP